MATATNKTRCTICGKEKATFRCAGCLEEFCNKHLADHRLQLHKQLDEIELNRDVFRQSLTEYLQKPSNNNNNTLIEQINKWEKDAIKKIQQTAEEARQTVLKNMNTSVRQLETELNKLTDQLRESRNEDDFNETNLRQFEEELQHLTNELFKPSNISIREDSTSFINKLAVEIFTQSSTPVLPALISSPKLSHDTRWIQNGVTIAGGNGQGYRLDHLNRPAGMYIDDDLTVYVADDYNHRIMEWKHGATTGQVVAGGNGQGNQLNQLNCPTDVVVDKKTNSLIICDFGNKRVVRWPRQNGTTGQTIISNIDCERLAMDNDGRLYISDAVKNEVKRWVTNDTYGTLVAGGNGKGNGLNQLNQPTFIFVDENHSVYMSDWANHRVMKWIKGAKEGILIAGGNGQGNSLTQLSNPQGLLVDQMGITYVVDRGNHRIMRYYQGSRQGSIIIGGNGQGDQANKLNTPIGLSFDRQGNLYVVDHWNHRVQRFDIDHC